MNKESKGFTLIVHLVWDKMSIYKLHEGRGII